MYVDTLINVSSRFEPAGFREPAALSFLNNQKGLVSKEIIYDLSIIKLSNAIESTMISKYLVLSLH